MSRVLLAIFAAHAITPAVSDSVQFFAAPPKANGPGLIVQHLNVSTSRQGYIPIVLTTVSSPVGFVHALPSSPEGCTGRVKTSDIAQAAGCHYAVNGKSKAWCP
jgi:hypothetical protein